MAASAPARSTALSGLHLLLTYECNFECDHCFVWGGPSQTGTMTDETIEHILEAGRGTRHYRMDLFRRRRSISLLPATCVPGLKLARERGFKVGIVTNAYWAITDAEAMEWLKPFAVPSKIFRSATMPTTAARTACGKHVLPARLRSTWASLSISSASPVRKGQMCKPFPVNSPAGESTVLYRGRAAEKLASRVQPKPWNQFTECPWEELRHPERVHVDAFGNLHICQGISIGNLFERPLTEIMRDYRPGQSPDRRTVTRRRPGRVSKSIRTAARARLRRRLPPLLHFALHAQRQIPRSFNARPDVRNKLKD